MSASQRGVSLLAALVLVGVLGVAAVSIESVVPSDNSQAQTAATAVPIPKSPPQPKDYAAPPNPTLAEQAGINDIAKNVATEAKKELAKKCDAAIKACQANPASCAITKDTKAKPRVSTLSDDCVAAVPDASVAAKYRCVGKSATVFLANTGVLEIKHAPNANVTPGKCKTVACQPLLGGSNTKLGATIGTINSRCSATILSGIDKAKIVDSLNGPNSFDAFSSGGKLIPQTTLDKATNDIVNSAFGKNPDDDTGSIPLDSKGGLEAPAADQIAKYAAEDPDPEVKKDSIALNEEIEKQVQLSPPPVTGASCSDNGNICNADNPSDAKKFQDAGWKCAKNPLLETVECFRPSTTQPPPHQGPCPNGQPVNPATGKCGEGSTFPPGSDGKTPPGGGTGPGDLLGKIAPFLGALAKALLAPKPPQVPPRACPTDQNQYAQYQQQYQFELQQYNYQLQQYNYQRQLNEAYGLGGATVPPPVQPTPCTPSTSQQCQSQPTQPPPGNCTAGTWKPNYNGACIVGWQCVPSSSGAPTASLSCEPKIADAGMTLAISYSCSAGTAVGSGFVASTSPSGSATTTIAAPPAGTNTATYRLTCNNNGVTTGAQCSVQVAIPSIVLVANPKTVPSGETSLIGWITTGMQSCVVSSPDDSAFTTRNSSNTSVAGTATTSPITSATNYLLHCQTIGGGTRDATTTVSTS